MLGHRLAVAAGAACALLSLLNDTPASTAALRGSLAWVAVMLHFRLSAKALRWRLGQERLDGRPAPQERPREAA
jgi:hypothetical protein